MNIFIHKTKKTFLLSFFLKISWQTRQHNFDPHRQQKEPEVEPSTNGKKYLIIQCIWGRELVLKSNIGSIPHDRLRYTWTKMFLKYDNPPKPNNKTLDTSNLSASECVLPVVSERLENIMRKEENAGNHVMMS